MSSRRIGFLSALATMLVVVSMGWSTTVAAPPVKSGKPITVQMTGAAERPGPGDPDGSGIATFWLNPGQGTICFELAVSNITLPATGAHIHEADVNNPGSIVVHLVAPGTSGTSSGCTDVDRSLVLDILLNPQDYYVNVHTLPLYGPGAVRGQLG